MSETSEQPTVNPPCDRCGGRMRLLNRAEGRVRVYWCAACARFAELPRE